MTISSKSNSHDLALQKYMLLQEQHESLCIHLDQIRHGIPTSNNYVSPYSTPSASPTRCSSASSTSSSGSSRRHSRSNERRRHGHGSSRAHARCSGWESLHRSSETLDTIPDEDTLYEISAEEQRLVDVNEGIKRALMELLGCEDVRRDSGMRMWVQTRLMETEKELRSGRRKRST